MTSSPKSKPLSETKIAVIGGGPQGLCALKNLLEEGFDAILLEQRNCIGGLWAYSDDPATITVLESTLANVSKWKNCYADFPIGKDEPVYYDQKKFLGYLERYVDHFNLRPRIQLNTKVLGISESKSGEQGWDVAIESSDAFNQRKKSLRFEKLIIATSAHHTPQIPAVQDSHLFRGQILHSSAFKRAQNFAGQNTMIVGFSNTAADISAELAHVAKSVLVSHRRGIHVLPRIVNGRPLDLFANRRLATISATMASLAPVRSLAISEKAVKDLSTKCWDLDPKWGFRPAAPRLTNRVMVSDTFVPQLTEGSIKPVANISRIIDGNTVELEDGSREHVDAIIFCTGYHRKIPPLFSNTELVNPGLVPHRLYQNIFPPSHADSLAFLDCWQLGSGICEVTDLACMAIAQIWKGTYPLPSVSQMNTEIDAHHSWVNTVLSGEPAAAAKVVQEGKWRHWLNAAAGTSVNEKLGYGFQGWWFWVTQPRFCNLLMSGVDSPHVMRLFDGRRKKWEGGERSDFGGERGSGEAVWQKRRGEED